MKVSYLDMLEKENTTTASKQPYEQPPRPYSNISPQTGRSYNLARPSHHERPRPGQLNKSPALVSKENGNGSFENKEKRGYERY